MNEIRTRRGQLTDATHDFSGDGLHSATFSSLGGIVNDHKPRSDYRKRRNTMISAPITSAISLTGNGEQGWGGWDWGS